MSDQSLDKQGTPKEENSTHASTNQNAHFAQAREIIKSWPEWKRNICCTPIPPTKGLK